MTNTCWIQLGAYGDLCAMLPMVLDEFIATGDRQNVMVSADYASLLDGCSYVNPIVYAGHYSELPKAAATARGMFQRLIVPQVYGAVMGKRSGSFVLDMWERAGKGHLFGRLPLVFDRRESVGLPETGSPLVLVAEQGKSSQFNVSPSLSDWLRSTELGPSYCIVSLKKIHPNFQYLLNVFRQAMCLVTIDTGHLHLSQASGVPVIALTADGENGWLGSPKYANQILNLRYHEFESRKGEIVKAIQGLPKAPAKLFHVWNDYQGRDGNTARRHAVCRHSWESEYRWDNWVPCVTSDMAFPSNAKTILNDGKKVPFIKDIIECAAAGAGYYDIIVYTNDDVCFMPQISARIIQACRNHESCWASRCEFGKLDSPPGYDMLRYGQCHVGADMFCFTKNWWEKHKSELPDFVIAHEAWDLVMKKLIGLHGGVELINCLAHEAHPAHWHGNRSSPASLYNRAQAEAWMKAHNTWYPA